MAVRWPLTVRRVHRWLALFVGLQVVLWTLTGFYMVAVHIDIIHGDHLVRAQAGPPVALASLSSPSSLVADGHATEVKLIHRLGQPMWKVSGHLETFVADARTGARVSPPDKAVIEAAARHIFNSDAPIVSTRLLTDLPQEVASRKPPLWQVEFAGWNRPTLYLDPDTAELVSRRHALWRVFDLAWMLHIMDYDERSDVNNPLLRVATISAAAMALSGAWLLYWSFPRKRRKKGVRA